MKKTKRMQIASVLGNLTRARSAKVPLVIAVILAIIGFGFTACGGDETHEHAWNQTWSSNAAQHWKECTGADCDAKSQLANHTPADGICTTCQYDNTPPHTHTYSTTWSSNATQHWKECTDASCDAKTQTANHAPADGVCTTCLYDNTPEHTHTYSSEWSSDETQHWKECTGAECEAKTDTADHTLARGLCTTCGYGTVIHTYDTVWYYSATQHWKECTFESCDAKTDTADHAPADGVCTTCGYKHTHTYGTTWLSNATQHWKECTFESCEAKTDTANHTPAHGFCTTCGYGTLTHTYSSEWSSNATQHWKECTFSGCDAKTDTADHTLAHGLCTTCGYGILHTWTTEKQNNVRPGINAKTCTYDGCDELSDIEFTLSIGDDGPGGGKIIYIADGLEGRTLGFTVTGAGSFTAYYLEAAPANHGPSFLWALSDFYNTNITGTGTAIGTGKANTAAILAIHADAPAAKACANYDGGGLNDWFLPSIDELNEMYQARSHLGISTGYFWSSSQVDNLNALSQNFDNGYWFKDGSKKYNSFLNVRAVRAF